MHRIFVAIEASSQIRGAVQRLVEKLRRAEAKVKWVEPTNVHLTLKFLGDATEQQVADVCRVVGQSASRVDPFEFFCHGAGAFPNTTRPRTVWVGVREGESQIVELHQKVDEALGELNFSRERRKFRPHLTVGRVRGGGPAVRELGSLIEKYTEFELGRAIVDELVVFSSELTREGPIYTPLSHAPLGSELGSNSLAGL